MATVRRYVTIDRSADDVWAVVGDPTITPRWFPGMVEATVDGRERVIVTAAGLRIPEEIVTLDPIQRCFEYCVTAGFVRDHRATIDVFDLGDDTSLVSYSTRCEPDALALMIGGAAGNALHELKRQMESVTDASDRGAA
ncbi:MAG: SRPBCC family protein [Actinomycetota bacterium]